MAEIDWDKIIKAARSKKIEEEKLRQEEEKRAHLERRLSHMENLLERIAEEKSKGVGASVAGSSVSRAIRPTHRMAVNDRTLKRLERLERMEKEISKKQEPSGHGLKIVKVPKKQFGRRFGLRAEPGVGSRISSKLGSRFGSVFSNKRNLILLIAVVAVASFATLYFTGNLNFINVSGLTGLFAREPDKPKTVYVCADGVTTVENMTMCPTTSTTTSTSTTSSTTTSISTTTTANGPPHSITVTGASCSSKTISIVVKNIGTVADNTGYLRFFVDGVESTTIVCTSIVMASGESTTCVSGTVNYGVHTVDVRGLVNSESATVSC